MAYDGNGNHSLPQGSIVQTGDKVLPSQHNPPLQDISASLSMVMLRDGRSPMVADLSMNGNRIRNLSSGRTPADAANVSQLPPIGAIMDYAGANAPEGWLLCYGQAISRSTYAALFAVIGTQFGNGNGSTTFNVPDLRGRVVAGVDNMGGTAAARLTSQTITGGANGRGASGGSQMHTLTTAQMPSHSHSVSGATNTAGAHTHSSTIRPLASAQDYNAAVTSGATGSGTTMNSAGAHAHSISGTAAAQGGGQAHPNVQPTMVLNKIIRATY